MDDAEARVFMDGLIRQTQRYGKMSIRELMHLADEQRDRIEALEAGLTEAISIIKIFHGPVAWDIYYKSSPEMKRLRALLGKEGA